MYNLLEYSSSYSVTTGILWFYSKDEVTNSNNDIENTDEFKYFSIKINYQDTLKLVEQMES